MDMLNPVKQYEHTATAVYSCQYHVIFTTKYRRKVLEHDVDVRLKELIKEKQSEYGYRILEMETMPDHVHLLLEIPPDLIPLSVIGRIKGYTAGIIRKEFPKVKSRIPSLWTRSKFIASVGAVSLETIKKYIEDQKNV